MHLGNPNMLKQMSFLCQTYTKKPELNSGLQIHYFRNYDWLHTLTCYINLCNFTHIDINYSIFKN